VGHSGSVIGLHRNCFTVLPFHLISVLLYKSHINLSPIYLLIFENSARVLSYSPWPDTLGVKHPATSPRSRSPGLFSPLTKENYLKLKGTEHANDVGDSDSVFSDRWKI